MRTGRNRALGKKAPGVQVRANFLAWPNAKTPASSLVIAKTGGCCQQETVKKVYAGSLKRVPAARLRLCLRCAVSWTGVARWSSVKERNLGEKVVMQKGGFFKETMYKK